VEAILVRLIQERKIDFAFYEAYRDYKADLRMQPRDENEDIKSILKKLKLIINEKLTNAAIMLFGKNPQKYFINALVRVGRFKDEITIIGDRRIEGNLFKQIEEAEEAIKNFINVRYEITGEQLTRKISGIILWKRLERHS